MDHKPLRVIAAADSNMGIGVGGNLPWVLPNESKYFLSRITAVSAPGKKNLVICGRRSAIKGGSSLPNCYTVVLSRTLSSVPENADYLCRDLPSALELGSVPPLSDEIETIWVIGGVKPFEEALKHPNCDQLNLTNIMDKFNAETFFPEFDRVTFKLLDEYPGVPSEIQEENGIKYKFQVFKKVHKQ
ncbi:dihydrofolate reductase [Scyliorhinus canicula]|uniref:dihydrofolate reductase n=1 Tax=Scyliorhinus canicula TaxID=7830 RepID=UPI0018F373CA|nr:dihydrofolate reductase [Scyliorhinus canicula]